MSTVTQVAPSPSAQKLFDEFVVDCERAGRPVPGRLVPAYLWELDSLLAEGFPRWVCQRALRRAVAEDKVGRPSLLPNLVMAVQQDWSAETTAKGGRR